jgi:carbonic anhydrase
MDPRLDPLAILGLEVGEAAILRNPGARVTDETLAGLLLARKLLGVDRVTVLLHTDCRAQPDPVEQIELLRGDVERTRAEGLAVEAFRYDVDTGALLPIS